MSFGESGTLAWVVRAVLIAVAVLALLLAVVWTFQRRLIYYPSSDSVPPAAAVLDGARDVTLRTSDGLRLGAWFVPAEGRPDRDMAVLVAGGNGGDRSVRAPLAAALAERGFSVLLFDYRGYAGNPGSPTEEGLARDVRAAYRFLVEDADVPCDRLLFFGESLGAAVVTELATEHPPAGLLLRSPFTDLAAVARVHYPFLPARLLLRDHYPLVDHLSRVEAPTTVVYGTDDTIVPPEQSRRVAAAAPGSTRVVRIEGAGHDDRVVLDGRELIAAVVALAERVNEAS